MAKSVSFRNASVRRIARQMHVPVTRIHALAKCRDGERCNGQGCRIAEWMGRR